jgi:hypothetical protein
MIAQNNPDGWEGLRKTLQLVKKELDKVMKPQMIVIWNEESTDIVPDPYRFETLKENAMTLITLN